MDKQKILEYVRETLRNDIDYEKVFIAESQTRGDILIRTVLKRNK